MDKARGSELLRARYTEDDAHELLRVAEEAGAELQDFNPFGLPAFEGATGTWRVPADKLGAVIEALVTVEKVPGFRGFPKGVVAVDAVDLAFEVGARRRF